VTDRNRKYYKEKMSKGYPSVIQHEVYHELNAIDNVRSSKDDSGGRKYRVINRIFLL
jgi:hypothetical protein